MGVWAYLMEAQKRVQSQENNESDKSKRAFLIGFAMGARQTGQRPFHAVPQPFKRWLLSTVPDEGAREGEEHSHIKEWSRNSAA